MTTPAPFLAPSLVNARAAINRAWPHRDHTTDGWIGNAAHQLVVSDHNPDNRGMVHAIDVDRDGIHVPTVLAGFLLSTSTRYVIFNRRIWQAKDGYAPREYKGENPHTGHIHESIQHTTAAEKNPALWTPIGGWSQNLTLIRLGSKGTLTRLVQAYCNAYWYPLVIDGDFGPATDKAVRRFQDRMGIKVDGIVGPVTRTKFATGRL